MNPQKKFIIMVAVLSLLAVACTDSLTKPTYISKYEAWINKLKAEYKEYKKADWSKAAADFKKYSQGGYKRFKDQFSEEEREKLDNLTGQYYALLTKHKVDQLKAELKSIMNKARGLFEELKKD